ncbi:MAG: hypothetical protein ACOVOQ_06365 [Flavobacterium sp.]
MRVKYNRVSTLVQTGNRFEADTDKYDKVFLDKISGSVSFKDRPKSKLLIKNINYYKIINVTKLYNDIENFNMVGKKDLFLSYDYFTESNWTYYVNPVAIDKDLTVISVTILPKEVLSCTPQAKTYEINVKSINGVKIDFSTGLFLNFGGNNFRDQTYRYEDIEDNTDQQKIIRNDSKNVIFPSVGTLMHVYKRTASDFNVGLTFGLSTKDFEKLNYHFGGSLILGSNKRFILSSGVTLTKANLISDNYYEGQIVNKATSPETIPTSSFNRIGYFTSLTFNLTSK